MKKTAAKSGMVVCMVLFLMTASEHAADPEAASFVLVDQRSGEVLLSKDAEKTRAIASLTKIAAAVVILEWMEDNGWDPAELRVRVPADAIRGGANPLGLQAGDEITIETGLFAAMMASDNTSMHSLAEMVGRQMIVGDASVSGISLFVDRMNQLASFLGMKSTRFVNPHGLDEEGEKGFSCASDVARLTLYAEDRVDFRRLVAERERRVSVFRGGREIPVTLRTTNELLGSRGIDGAKTGTTRLAGACFVVTAGRALQPEEGGGARRLLAVLLDSPDRFREAVLLLDRGWKVLEERATGAGSGTKESLRKQAD